MRGHFVVMLAEGDCNKQANTVPFCVGDKLTQLNGHVVKSEHWQKDRAQVEVGCMHCLLYETRHLKANNNCENKFINYDNSYELL